VGTGWANDYDGGPHEYLCVVYLRSTGDEDWTKGTPDPGTGTAYMWQTITQPDPVQLTWDGSASPGGQADVYTRDSYTFEIGIFEYEDAERQTNLLDCNYFKWPYCLQVADSPEHQAFAFVPSVSKPTPRFN